MREHNRHRCINKLETGMSIIHDADTIDILTRTEHGLSPEHDGGATKAHHLLPKHRRRNQVHVSTAAAIEHKPPQRMTSTYIKEHNKSNDNSFLIDLSYSGDTSSYNDIYDL